MKIGDKVILVDLRCKFNWPLYDDDGNPLWKGRHGKVIGTITDMNAADEIFHIEVEWNNGCSNYYNEKHLSLYKKILIKEILK